MQFAIVIDFGNDTTIRWYLGGYGPSGRIDPASSGGNYMKYGVALSTFLVSCLIVLHFAPTRAWAEDFDIVILNGRVMDPESRLDAVRNIGISGGTIREITS